MSVRSRASSRRTGRAENRESLRGRWSCRPHLEMLEERLPPGDMVLGGFLTWLWTGHGLPAPGDNQPAATSRVTASLPSARFGMHSVRVSDFLAPGLSSRARASLPKELVDVRGQLETSDAGLDAGRVGLQDSVDWNDGEWMPRPVPHLSPVTVSSPVVQRSAETSGASPLIGPNQIAAPDPAYPPSPSLEPSSHSGSFDLATWQKTGVPKTSPADQSSANFDLVSSNPLFARGMNAAPAIFDHYIYIGNRTDGSAMHPHPGVLVVDVADPSQPRIVSEIGAPFEGNANETSRELRVWPDASLLMIMNFTCDRGLHACQGGSVRPTIKFYDLSGDYAAHPELISAAHRLNSKPPHMATSRTTAESSLSAREILFASTAQGVPNQREAGAGHWNDNRSLSASTVDRAEGSWPTYSTVIAEADASPRQSLSSMHSVNDLGLRHVSLVDDAAWGVRATSAVSIVGELTRE